MFGQIFNFRPTFQFAIKILILGKILFLVKIWKKKLRKQFSTVTWAVTVPEYDEEDDVIISIPVDIVESEPLSTLSKAQNKAKKSAERKIKRKLTKGISLNFIPYFIFSNFCK